MEQKISRNTITNSISINQDLLFRQENFPRNRIFRIYPPKSSQSNKMQPHNLKIDSLITRGDLKISNLPIIERAHLQKYNVKCNQKKYSIMVDAPKYIFDAYHFNFVNAGIKLSKTHYFAIAPTLRSQDNEPGLPILYRLSVCRDTTNPQHFSFSMYAIMGGYSDGFYFMSRLDNHIPEYSHICKSKKSKVSPHHFNGDKEHVERIDFPHIHYPNFNQNNSRLQEFATPTHIPRLKGESFYNCLNAYMITNNISPQMILAYQDMDIDELTQYALTFHACAKCLSNLSPSDLGKIAMADLSQFEAYAEYNQTEDYLPHQECGTPYLKS